MRRVRQSQGIVETQEDRQRDRNRQALAESFDQANNRVWPLSVESPPPFHPPPLEHGKQTGDSISFISLVRKVLCMPMHWLAPE